MVSLIPLVVGNTFVTLTWNGSVHLAGDGRERPQQPATAKSSTHPSVRHQHHIETRHRLTRHLLLKFRHFKESPLQSPPTPATDSAVAVPSGPAPTTTTTTVKLSPSARQYTIQQLQPNTAYEFCIEFQPNSRPTTLLDCLVLRTTTDDASRDSGSGAGMGYHQGHTILFLFLVVIVGGVSSICFGCYTYAVGRKLWKYHGKKGTKHSSQQQGYRNDGCPEAETGEEEYAQYSDSYRSSYSYSYYEDSNPSRPLIARI